MKKQEKIGIRSRLQKLSTLNGEDEIRSEVGELFELLGLPDKSLQHRVGRWFADLVFYSARLVIETKARGKVNPEDRGSGLDETQKGQLARYLEKLTAKEISPSDQPWRGVLTDGETWHVYEWNTKSHPGREKSGPRSSRVAEPRPSLYGWNDERMREIRPKFQFQAKHNGRAESFIEFFRQYLAPEKRRGKPAPPSDLGTSVLQPFFHDLAQLAENAEGDPHFNTKFRVWKSVLKGAGLLPPEGMVSRTRRLFREHTALVVTARGILNAMGKTTQRDAGLDRDLNSGFVSWLQEVTGGAERTRQLFQDLEKYEWRGTTRDVMRTAYEQLIKAEDRKEFGEYYTPDWLATAVCEDVLDVDWLNHALAAARQALTSRRARESRIEPLLGIGVLDPACGSGTFLFHAARRIVDHAVRERGFSPKEACHAAAILVHGMDIHPVAVEMSRAVLRTALPDLDDQDAEHLSVYVGDSLQTDEFQSGTLLGKDTVYVQSTKDHSIEIPRDLLSRPDFSVLIECLVGAALEKEPLNLCEFEMDKSLEKKLQIAYRALKKICRDEGNHVWAWKIRNTAKPLQLTGSGVDRLIGNPPWIVSNDTPEGVRKQAFKEMTKGYGLRDPKLHRSSAKGDLAALFAVRAIDLYLASGDGRKGGGGVAKRFAFVLPGSALINQVWRPFRTGNWQGKQHRVEATLETPWDLGGVKEAPFPHAPNQACVVRGYLGAAQQLPKAIFWKASDVELEQDWETARRLIRQSSGSEAFPEPKASLYVREFHLGVMLRPLCLGLTTDWESRGDLIRFTTYRSTKGPWKGKQYRGEMEAEATHSLLRSQTLRAFRALPDALLLAPLRDESIADLETWPKAWLPKARKWFREHEKVFQKYRSSKSAPSLLGNINWKNTFTRQYLRALKSPKALRKVVYNASGSSLRAARVVLGLAVNAKCYYAILTSEKAAAYLVATLNAPCLLPAWNHYKTSRLDYDLNPLRSVPVPVFDKTDELHLDLVGACLAAEQAVAQSNSAKDEIPHEILERIDRCVRSLLKEYVQ